MTKGERAKERVYAAIGEFLEAHGYSPTLKEICAMTGLRSPASVKDYLDILCKEGRIERPRPYVIVLKERK